MSLAVLVLLTACTGRLKGHTADAAKSVDDRGTGPVVDGSTGDAPARDGPGRDACLPRAHGSACQADCGCSPPLTCRRDPTRLNSPGGGCCAQGEYWVAQLGTCRTLSNDGFCFGFAPYQESCASSPSDCCVCSGSGTAFLHGDVWPFWFNGRTVCDKEYKAYWRCTLQGGDCTAALAAKSACDRCQVVDGKCNEAFVPGGTPCTHSCDQGKSCDSISPGTKCGYGYYSSCHSDCAVSTFDYDALWGHFYADLIRVR